jgi:hypothetical protein
MKSNFLYIILASALLMLLSGCSFISSAQTGDTGTTGEVWYVRTGIFGSGKVYYCPAGENVCYQADMRRN